VELVVETGLLPQIRAGTPLFLDTPQLAGAGARHAMVVVAENPAVLAAVAAVQKMVEIRKLGVPVLLAKVMLAEQVL
jgi:hypothetical protein